MASARASEWPRSSSSWRCRSRSLCGDRRPLRTPPPHQRPPVEPRGSRPRPPLGEGDAGRNVRFERHEALAADGLCGGGHPGPPPLRPSSSRKITASLQMTAAVVGHVEWIEFVRVERMPVAGEIVHAAEAWEEPGGGGAVAAVQLAKLGGGATFFTALGDDQLGHRAKAELEALGL